MAETPEPDRRLLQLAGMVREDAISAEQLAELEQHLLSDATKRKQYAQYMHLHGLLRWELSGPPGSGATEPSQPASLGGALPVCPSAETPIPGLACGAALPLDNESAASFFSSLGWHSFPRIMGIVVCMAILAGGIGLAVHWRCRPVSLPSPVAELTDIEAATWPAEVAPPVAGTALQPGLLRVESGTAQVTFGNGAVLALTGPAELELIAADRAQLRFGRAVPYVPERARGFTLLTPQGTIVDLGTEFLVDVQRNGNSDVQVINGKVQLSTGRGAAGGTYLPAGYGARIRATTDTNLPSITQVPLLIDEFETADAADLNSGLRQRQAGLAAPIRYVDLDRNAPSRLHDGRLSLRLESRAGRFDPLARVALDRDFKELAGHRYTITFTAMLPEGPVGNMTWLALVLEDGEGRTAPRVSPAYSPQANLSVLLSPRWQVAARVQGKHIRSVRIFQREGSRGPYQVVLRMDETEPGNPRAWLVVNGREVVHDLPVALGAGRYLGFQSYILPSHSNQSGYVEIDNLRISVEPDAMSATAGNPASGAPACDRSPALARNSGTH